MNLLETLQLISGISGIISALAILIIIWDHIIDDIKLKNRVQYYYEMIVNLIFTSLETEYYNVWKYETIRSIDKESFKKKYLKLYDRKTYFQTVVFNEMLKYCPYVGLTYLSHADARLASLKFRDSFDHNLLNREGFSLNGEIEGFIYLTKADHIDLSGTSIREKDIEFIEEFLTSLRDFWKSKYHRPLFRPKLKSTFDDFKGFKDVSGYKKPLYLFKNKDNTEVVWGFKEKNK